MTQENTRTRAVLKNDSISEDSDTLDAMRERIDELDTQLLETLAKRMKVVDRVGKYKKERDIPPLDAGRWQKVLDSRGQKGTDLGLPREFVVELYELIHKLALQIEAKESE